MTKEIILSKEDFALLSHYVKYNSSANKYTIKKLAGELQAARVVEQDKLPSDVVRLNSEVKLRLEGETREIKVKLVMPDRADIKQNKISVFAPMGSALIGYQEGDTISWEVPVGPKKIEVLEVINT